MIHNWWLSNAKELYGKRDTDAAVLEKGKRFVTSISSIKDH